MEIKEAREGDVLVLTPDGNLITGEECAVLEGKLAGVPASTGKAVVLDCAAVGQLTSPALRALLLASRKLTLAKGRLVICSVNAKVRKAFAISGFDRDFTVVATREEAVQRALEPPLPKAVREKRSPERQSVTPPPAMAAAESEAASAAAPQVSDLAGPAPLVPEGSAVPSPPPSHDALAIALIQALGGRPRAATCGASAAPRDLGVLAAAIAGALTGRRA